MNGVEGFVHLYHVWMIYGGVTALIYGQASYQSWQQAGGQWRTAPAEFTGYLFGGLWQVVADWTRLVRWMFAGLTGLSYRWPEPVPAKYARDHTLLLGITLGGLSRFLTALYWSEKNRAWMTETNVWLPAVPVALAVLADANHQLTAWSKRPWIARMLLSGAVIWVLIGLFW